MEELLNNADLLPHLIGSETFEEAQKRVLASDDIMWFAPTEKCCKHIGNPCKFCGLKFE